MDLGPCLLASYMYNHEYSRLKAQNWRNYVWWRAWTSDQSQLSKLRCLNNDEYWSCEQFEELNGDKVGDLSSEKIWSLEQ